MAGSLVNRLDRLERAAGNVGTPYYVVDVAYDDPDKAGSADRAMREAGLDDVPDAVVIVLDWYDDASVCPRVVNHFRGNV